MINIEVRVRKFEKKNDDEYGKKGDVFYSYKGYSPKLGWTDLKLTQNCEVKALKNNCTLNVEVSQVSVDKKSKFPIIWISELKNSQVVVVDYVKNVEDYFKE